MNLIGSYGGDFLFHLMAVLSYLEHSAGLVVSWVAGILGSVVLCLWRSGKKGGSLLGNMVTWRRA